MIPHYTYSTLIAGTELSDIASEPRTVEEMTDNFQTAWTTPIEDKYPDLLLPMFDAYYQPTIQLLHMEPSSTDRDAQALVDTYVFKQSLHIPWPYEQTAHIASPYEALSYRWGPKTRKEQEGAYIEDGAVRPVDIFVRDDDRDLESPFTSALHSVCTDCIIRFSGRCCRSNFARHRRVRHSQELNHPQWVAGSSKYCMDGVCIERSGNRHLVRRALAAANRAVAEGKKGASAPLDDITTVIEIMERRGWQSLVGSILWSLGCVLPAILVVLYQPGTSVPDQEPIAKYRELARSALSSILPSSLVPSIVDPTPSLFIASTFILGFLVTLQYQHNKTSSVIKPFFTAGAVLGCLASIVLCTYSDVAVLTAATTIVPTAIVVSLLMGSLADALRRALLPKDDRKKRLQQVLQILQLEEKEGHRAGQKRSVRFVFVE